MNPRARPRFGSRRRLIASSLWLGALGTLAWTRARPLHARDARDLRPPGALAPGAFEAACVRCGLCVRACPPQALHLSTESEGPAPPGTPHLRVRERPCLMCDGLPCVRACPTGALDPALQRAGAMCIGLASLSDPKACFSYTGAAACRHCWSACPLKNRALRMRAGATPLGGRLAPVVDAEACTGCGLCEHACVAAAPAITVRLPGDGPA